MHRVMKKRRSTIILCFAPRSCRKVMIWDGRYFMRTSLLLETRYFLKIPKQSGYASISLRPCPGRTTDTRTEGRDDRCSQRDRAEQNTCSPALPASLLSPRSPAPRSEQRRTVFFRCASGRRTACPNKKHPCTGCSTFPVCTDQCSS